MLPEDSKIDVLGETHRLLEAWCDRRAYDAICTLYGGFRMLNGLTDGWEVFLQSLKRLRMLAKVENSPITTAEADKIQLLIGVVSRALNSR
jgi:hypothetical protein